MIPGAAVSKSPFQRQMERDQRNTFLNARELARVCDWNGGPLKIVEAAIESGITEDALGLLGNIKRIFCDASDLPSIPKPNDTVELDGDEWIVQDAYQNQLSYVILLERPESQCSR